VIRRARLLRAAAALLLAGAFPAAGCAPAAPPAAGPSAGGAVSEHLFLGRALPEGARVTEEAWRTFLDEEVTPRFPDGLTVTRAEGRWRAADGAVLEEDVFVLEIVHGGGDREARLIGEIADAYRERFRQESVMRVTGPVRWRFH
jgi:hypothetical protein